MNYFLRLKKAKFLVLVLLMISTKTFSQSITFCESVDESGIPKGASHVFNITKDGGYFDFLINLPKGVNSTSVTYDIFRLDTDGKEVLENTIKQDVQLDWNVFYQKVTFHTAADYTVYVYDDREQLLCSGMVKVIMR